MLSYISLFFIYSFIYACVNFSPLNAICCNRMQCNLIVSETLWKSPVSTVSWKTPPEYQISLRRVASAGTSNMAEWWHHANSDLIKNFHNWGRPVSQTALQSTTKRVHFFHSVMIMWQEEEKAGTPKWHHHSWKVTEQHMAFPPKLQITWHSETLQAAPNMVQELACCIVQYNHLLMFLYAHNGFIHLASDSSHGNLLTSIAIVKVIIRQLYYCYVPFSWITWILHSLITIIILLLLLVVVVVYIFSLYTFQYIYKSQIL